MHIKIHINNQGTIEIDANKGQSLAKAIWLSGKLSPPPLCSALGRCGQCKVIFISPAPKALEIEENLLKPQELDQGLRLACRHNLESLQTNSDGSIELSIPTHLSKNKKTIKVQSKDHAAYLAIDLGTTSLHWQATNTQGEIIAQGQQINPQMGAGSDIISRLAYAMEPEGTKILSKLVIQAVQKVLAQLPPVTEICLAANTAMSGIFLQKCIKSLAVAPYKVPLNGNSIEHLENLPPIYIPPQLAPFVGGDISAGYAALMQEDNIEFPFIFVDLGTNGEFILAHDIDHAHITSVPLGPALEGIGLTFGQMAQSDAGGIVNSVRISPHGLEPTTLDGSAPQRICGTGYLSLLSCLLKIGILEQSGHFCDASKLSTPLSRKLHSHIETHAGEQIFRLWPHIASQHGMYISSTDIEEILKVKAAFSLAMQELLSAAQLTAKDIKALYLGGAMGSYVEGSALEALGFIPLGINTRLERVGNTSLAGAALLLNEPQKRDWLYKWSKQYTHIQLAEHNDFIQKYMQHMHFNFNIQ